MEPTLHCPHPLKVRYLNALEACEALIRIKAEPPKPGGYLPVSFYECRCGGWHLSSRPPLSADIARQRGMPPRPMDRVPDPPSTDS